MNEKTDKQQLPQRKAMRLTDYDYSTRGYYFITIVVNKRLCLLGHVHDGQMIMNEAAKELEKSYYELPNIFADVECVEHIFMPNHFHCIIGLRGDGESNLSEILRWWKSYTTNLYIRGVRQRGWQPFHQRLWQGRFYDHIIRNQRDLDYIRNYIYENPMRWGNDHHNPDCPLSTETNNKKSETQT